MKSTPVSPSRPRQLLSGTSMIGAIGAASPKYPPNDVVLHRTSNCLILNDTQDPQRRRELREYVLIAISYIVEFIH